MIRRPLAFRRALARLSSFALVSALSFGCMGGELIQIPHDQHAFTGDGHLLLIEFQPNQIRATSYDIEGGSARWRDQPPGSDLVLSRNGRFAAFPAAALERPADLELGVLQLENGQISRTGVRLERPPRFDVNALLREFVTRTAVSDDGQVIATVVAGELRIYDLRTKGAPWTLEVPPSACVVSFAPGGRRLVLGCAQAGALGAVTVLDPEGTGGGWRRTAKVEGASPAFTARGLMLLAPGGVATLADGAVKVLAAGFRAEEGQFSADGRYVAYRQGRRIFDLDQRKDVVDAAAPGWVSFRGPVAFVFQRDGDLWRYDLATGGGRKLRSFGKPSETVKIPFFGGTTTSTSYRYDLSDDGKYLYYRSDDDAAKKRARVFKLEQL